MKFSNLKILHMQKNLKRFKFCEFEDATVESVLAERFVLNRIVEA